MGIVTFYASRTVGLGTLTEAMPNRNREADSPTTPALIYKWHIVDLFCNQGRSNRPGFTTNPIPHQLRLACVATFR